MGTSGPLHGQTWRQLSSAPIHCWGPPGTPCRSPLLPAPGGAAPDAPPLPAPLPSRAPLATPRLLIRTGRSGRALPGARTAARLRPPLSASFVCPAPSRRRRRPGLWGADPERRAQLARARWPGARGARPGQGCPSAGGRRSPPLAALPTPSPRSRPALPRPACRLPLPSSPAQPGHILPPPAHLSAQSPLRGSGPGCPRLPQASASRLSTPAPPAGQVRLGLGPPLAPPSSLTWLRARTKVGNLARSGTGHAGRRGWR